MSAVVAVVGEGMLADFVCQELWSQYRLIRRTDLSSGLPETVTLALVLHDTWLPHVHQEAEEVLRRTGIPWIRGFVSFGEGIAGPLVRPGTPGCSQCAEMRLLMAGSHRRETWELRQRLAERTGAPYDSWASRTGLLQMAYVFAEEAMGALQAKKSRLEGRLILISMKTLKSSSHFILPDPLCSVCGRLPDDMPEAARITLKPNPKLGNGSYRIRALDDLKEALVKDYLDYRTGFMNGKMHEFRSTFADVSVNLPLMTGDEGAAGRTHSYEESELTAILEGLERHCGMAPRGKQTVVRGSYRDLEDQALDPVKAGVHAEDMYARPDFPFTPFDPELPMDWVWGYSFLRERPILVPQLLAYYSIGCGQGFVYETSNGCALGGSMEEAIFYGILEVVERDSFLMTWYAQLPLPRLDLYSVDDRELRLMVERLRAVAGYELYAFNATMENGIPSIWVTAKNTKQKGINLICAAGAHPDPIRAVKGAILENASMLLTLDEKFEANREQYMQMLEDPFLVRHMDDHSMLYALPQAEERLHFLLNDKRPYRTFEEEFGRKVWHSDLAEDLKDYLLLFRRLNLEVIVVDQTTQETRLNGLYCVKVLIPGMLPMTFGHHLTRLNGLERVLRVPAELGYATNTLTCRQLNPYPHPFP